jgi:Domain of unknown function DUF11
VHLRDLTKRARWLITVGIAVITTAGLLSAPAAAAVRPQMEAQITYDPAVVRAPVAGGPDRVVTYTGTFFFRGDESTPTATKTTATLTLPSGVAVQSLSPSGCQVKKKVVTCSFGTVPSGQAETLTVRTKVVNAQVGDRLGATLVASAKNVDRNPGGGSSENTGPLVVANSADLSTGFSGWRDSVAPGAEMSYDIHADNSGPLTTAPAVLNIKVGPQLPDPQVRVDGTNSCTRTADGFRCPFVQRISLELTGTVDPASEGTVLSTSLSVAFTGDDPPADPDSTNDTAAKTTHVEQPADIGVDLTVTPGTVAPADLADEPELTYHATVTNKGPGTARETTLDLQFFDDGVEFVGTPDGCETSAGLHCDVGELAVGASREFVIHAKATPLIRGERVELWSQVNAANNDFERPDDNQRSAFLSVPGNLADLGVAMRADPSPVAGQPVSVLVTATNHGPLPKADAEVQIHLDTPLGDDAKAEVDGGTCRVADTSNDYFECTLPGVSAEGKVIKVTGSSRLAAGDELGGSASIRAVDDRPDDPELANNFTQMSVLVGS